MLNQYKKTYQHKHYLCKRTYIKKGGRVISEETKQTNKEIEAIISQIRGVTSGRVVYEGNAIVEIHVLADGSRSPKQVVRDIESAVLVKLGITLDHKRISVAQLGEDENPLPMIDLRLRLLRFGYSNSGGESIVSITITLDEEVFEASASGPGFNQNRLRLTARATLAAIEKYLNVENLFMLSDVKKIHIANHESIIVAVSYFRNSREEILLGAALNTGDELESAAKATMDAINRRLMFIEVIKN